MGWMFLEAQVLLIHGRVICVARSLYIASDMGIRVGNRGIWLGVLLRWLEAYRKGIVTI